MNINGTSVMLSEEDRNWLKLFFQRNNEFIENNSLIEYDNLSTFINLYEQFLDENNLRENDILMLFLAELKCEQLSYKITRNSNKMRIRRLDASPIKLSDTIKKWRDESNIICYIRKSDPQELDRDMKNKVLQNRFERTESWKSAREKIIGQQ